VAYSPNPYLDDGSPKKVLRQIVEIVNFATKCKNQLCIYYSIAGSLDAFGKTLKSWLGLLDIQPQDWIGFTLSKNGGGI
jgi:hypothetical protein